MPEPTPAPTVEEILDLIRRIDEVAERFERRWDDLDAMIDRNTAEIAAVEELLEAVQR